MERPAWLTIFSWWRDDAEKTTPAQLCLFVNCTLVESFPIEIESLTGSISPFIVMSALSYEHRKIVSVPPFALNFWSTPQLFSLIYTAAKQSKSPAVGDWRVCNGTYMSCICVHCAAAFK